MKTLQELYKEVIASEELKNEFMEAAKDEKEGQKKVEEFMKKYDCDATLEELKSFFEEKSQEELDEEELEAVAGGKSGEKTAMTIAKPFISIVLVGLGCLGPVAEAPCG